MKTFVFLNRAEMKKLGCDDQISPIGQKFNVSSDFMSWGCSVSNCNQPGLCTSASFYSGFFHKIYIDVKVVTKSL